MWIRLSVCAALGVILLLPSPAQAKQVYCQHSAAAPIVTVRTNDGDLRLDHSITTAQLQDRAREAKVRSSTPGRAMGLTAAFMTVETKARTSMSRATNGGLCAFFSHIDLTIQLKDLTVYIDQRYPKGTCQYNEILRHESKHVSIYRRYAQELGMRYRAAIPSIDEKISPMLLRRQDESNQLFQLLEAELQPLLKQSQEGQRKENGAIDTPQSYREFNRLCPSW